MKTFLSFILLFSAGLFAAAPGAPTPARIYQCSMHPWIKSDHPGKCTICGMDLVVAAATSGANDPNLVTLTSAQVTVAGVQTAPVTRGVLRRSLRVNGVIDDDETRHRILAARVPGRVEKLHVNYVGAEVREGEPLATIYSPEMLTAQRTYVERLKAGASAFSASQRAEAREKLLELGLTDEEVGILERTLEPTAMVNLRAPMSGTVVARNVYEGQQINQDNAENETRLFEIGDFSRMWFVFDAYEADLAWIRPGLTVEVSVPSLPDRALTAPIAFIDPNLNETTRTARVRVVLENRDHHLLHKQTAQGIVRLETPDAMLVPRSAVLQHSGHPVVFVETTDRAYAAREIQLGRVGDTDAEVLAGLTGGERVVVQGALLLDSQAQLAHAALGSEHDHADAPPQLVSAAPTPAPAATTGRLEALAFAAADAAATLAADDLAAYAKNLPALRTALQVYLADEEKSPLAKYADALVDGPDLRTARRAFEPFSTALADVTRENHLHHRAGLHVFQCPMTPVLGTGRWLSRSAELRNPYFGSAMLECGEELN